MNKYSENILKEARKQNHTCETCYYKHFGLDAFPCSRCVNNEPIEDQWKPEWKPQEPIPKQCPYCKAGD